MTSMLTLMLEPFQPNSANVGKSDAAGANSNRMIAKEFKDVLDVDGDGEVSLEEYTAAFDADGDGVVDLQEEAIAHSRMKGGGC